MAWATTKGFNFRETLGFVTDGANEQFVPVTAAYPTTNTIGGESVTYGWENPSGVIQPRQRDSSIDRRLGSFHFADGAARDFRVDLLATSVYRIRLALGDYWYGSAIAVDIKDDASVLFSVNDGSVAAGSFVDAMGTELTLANWPSLNAQREVTFTSTIFRLHTEAGAAKINHIEIEQMPAAGEAPRSPVVSRYAVMRAANY